MFCPELDFSLTMKSEMIQQKTCRVFYCSVLKATLLGLCSETPGFRAIGAGPKIGSKYQINIHIQIKTFF